MGGGGGKALHRIPQIPHLGRPWNAEMALAYRRKPKPVCVAIALAHEGGCFW